MVAWKEKDPVWVSDPEKGFLQGHVCKLSPLEVECCVDRRTTKTYYNVREKRLKIFPRNEKMPADSMDPATRRRTLMQQARRSSQGSKADPTCNDCTSLIYLDEANILDNLKRRYAMDDIYTFTSTVLFAVNPYKQVFLDTQLKREEYRNLASIHAKPPHPYALADQAYRQLLCDKGSQAMVISGESGAGKTETAKLVMKFLAERSRTNSESASSLQEKILSAANPLLESFGNATTIRNGNSSRFGKYNNLCFNPVGSLVGAEVRTYLLESSRVLNTSTRERTYHVFYEFFAGCGDALKDFGLDITHVYRLLQTSANPRNDADNFIALLQGLDHIDVSDVAPEGTPEGQTTERLDLWKLLAAIIHFGECYFQGERDEEIELVSRDHHYNMGCQLAGFDEEKLYEGLTRSKSVAGRVRGSTIDRANTVEQANGLLQSLVKILYSRLFDWIVGKVNAAVEFTDTARNYIGILDIYGFEQLERNSLEQLCINLANERLQQFFVEKVLVGEQEMYRKEGLGWTDITLPDSGPVLADLRTCLLTLDDINKQVSKGLNVNEETFTNQMHQKRCKNILPPFLGKKSKRKNPLGKSEGFVVSHYAGEVEYETIHWIAKNDSRLKPTLEQVIRDSENIVVQRLKDDEACNMADTNLQTIGKKYITGLDNLMDTLSDCQLHYIRCFKPNNTQEPDNFQGSVVLDQMLQSGTVELVRMMHDGYPNRIEFNDLYVRYCPLLPPDFVEQLDARLFVEALMVALDVPTDEWTLGTTRLFLKAGRLAVIEKLRESGNKIDSQSEIILKLRKWIAKKKFRRCLLAVAAAICLKNQTKAVRRQRNLERLAKCARTYVRIMRAVRRAQASLKEKRLTSLAIKVRASLRTWVYLMAALARARSRISRMHAMEFLHYWYKMTLLNITCRRWLRNVVKPAARRRKRNEELIGNFCQIVHLRRHLMHGPLLERARQRIHKREIERQRQQHQMYAKEVDIHLEMRKKYEYDRRVSSANKREYRQRKDIEMFETFNKDEEEDLWAEREMELAEEEQKRKNMGHFYLAAFLGRWGARAKLRCAAKRGQIEEEEQRQVANLSRNEGQRNRTLSDSMDITPGVTRSTRRMLDAFSPLGLDDDEDKEEMDRVKKHIELNISRMQTLQSENNLFDESGIAEASNQRDVEPSNQFDRQSSQGLDRQSTKAAPSNARSISSGIPFHNGGDTSFSERRRQPQRQRTLSGNRPPPGANKVANGSSTSKGTSSTAKGTGRVATPKQSVGIAFGSKLNQPKPRTTGGPSNFASSSFAPRMTPTISQQPRAGGLHPSIRRDRSQSAQKERPPSATQERPRSQSVTKERPVLRERPGSALKERPGSRPCSALKERPGSRPGSAGKERPGSAGKDRSASRDGGRLESSDPPKGRNNLRSQSAERQRGGTPTNQSTMNSSYSNEQPFRNHVPSRVLPGKSNIRPHQQTPSKGSLIRPPSPRGGFAGMGGGGMVGGSGAPSSSANTKTGNFNPPNRRNPIAPDSPDMVKGNASTSSRANLIQRGQSPSRSAKAITQGAHHVPARMNTGLSARRESPATRNSVQKRQGASKVTKMELPINSYSSINTMPAAGQTSRNINSSGILGFQNKPPELDGAAPAVTAPALEKQPGSQPFRRERSASRDRDLRRPKPPAGVSSSNHNMDSGLGITPTTKLFNALNESTANGNYAYEDPSTMSSKFNNDSSSAADNQMKPPRKSSTSNYQNQFSHRVNDVDSRRNSRPLAERSMNKVEQPNAFLSKPMSTKEDHQYWAVPNFNPINEPSSRGDPLIDRDVSEPREESEPRYCDKEHMELLGPPPSAYASSRTSNKSPGDVPSKLRLPSARSSAGSNLAKPEFNEGGGM